MIVLGIILFVIGVVIASRPLLYVGGLLVIIGLVLWATSVPGPIYGGYY